MKTAKEAINYIKGLFPEKEYSESKICMSCNKKKTKRFFRRSSPLTMLSRTKFDSFVYIYCPQCMREEMGRAKTEMDY